ncbi:MAG: transglutaminaseTgpA domain-containing protein, partial [Candidatus Omnitrophota bacterium]|nr:transglutaminaseTgpA domain-containing protein [Candidatus Omnitrophota bacterium]
MRDRNTLYFHFANLGLVLVGLFSVQAIFHPFVFIIVLPGTIAGFFVSWYLKEKRPDHMDTFIGMLSLAAVVIILSRVYDNAITFENLLRGFSITLVWLMLFQSFGLRTGKSYALIQFITACLLISSVAIALEDEMFYIILLAAYLFIFIFSMRLSLVCEQKRKGSKIIGDETDVMSLPQQIKVGAFMFALVLLVASFVYPLVPRFESISFSWIPSTLLGIPERVPLLKMFKQAPLTVKDNDKMKKEQPIMDEKI